MPYAFSTFTLPCGAPAVLANGTGIITRSDAEDLVKRTTRGGEYDGRQLLIDNRQMERMEPEARNFFGLTYDPNAEHPWCAIIVPDPVLRVSVSFLLRTTKTTRVKLFSSQPEAIAWLDGQVREDAAWKADT